MKFKGGTPIPQPEYIEKAKQLPETEAKRILGYTSERYFDLYQDGIWSREELLAVKLEQEDSRRKFKEKLRSLKHSEPSTPPASS